MSAMQTEGRKLCDHKMNGIKCFKWISNEFLLRKKISVATEMVQSNYTCAHSEQPLSYFYWREMCCYKIHGSSVLHFSLSGMIFLAESFHIVLCRIISSVKSFEILRAGRLAED